MSKIHPARSADYNNVKLDEFKLENGSPSKLTVWKRSSMSFQGTDGFTVFDHNGKLVFRVDNYSRDNPSLLVLMDATGSALITLKAQRMSLQKQWNGYRGEAQSRKFDEETKLFSMRSPNSMAALFTKSSDHKLEAEVSMNRGDGDGAGGADFRIEGSFRCRNCCIRTADGQVAAKITRKRVSNSTVVLSQEVFSLVVQPGFDAVLLMAFVLVLDRVSSKPLAPLLCH